MINLSKSIILFVIAGCNLDHSMTSFRMGDRVRFKFEERNLFYANVCSNTGTIHEQSPFKDKDEYLVGVECLIDNNYRTKMIWVKAESIIEVLKLN